MIDLRWPALLLALGLIASPAIAAGLVIEHATVLPMTGAAPMADTSVVIEDGKIVAILPSGTAAPRGHTREKMLSNIQEIKARKGVVVIVATEGDSEAHELADYIIEIPACEEELSPILAVVPLQLLAYYTATQLGRDVDKPRNLAKSVTVE